VSEEDDPSAAPSSLEDAVMRELSDRSPVPGASRPGSDPPPIIEPHSLKRRSSNPPVDGETEGTLPSIPPDAVVPGAGSTSDEMMAASAHSSEPLIVPARLTGPPLGEGADKDGGEASGAETDPFKPPLAEVLPPSVAARLRPALKPEAEILDADLVSEPPPPMEAPQAPKAQQASPAATAPAAKAPATKAAPTKAARKPRKTSGAVWFLMGLTGLAVAAAIAFRTMSEPEATPTVVATESAGPMPPPTALTAAAAGTATATAAPSGAAAASASAGASSAQPAGDDLPPGAEVPPGYGMITVTAPAGARVRVDGAIAGKGPSVMAVAAPGYHDVRVENAGRETKSVVEVRSGKVARVESADQP
jgi:hypothetical protein